VQLFPPQTRQPPLIMRPFISGRYYDTSLLTQPPTTKSTNASFAEAYPFWVATPAEIDLIGLEVLSGTGGGEAQLGAYNTLTTGLPGDRLFATSKLDCSATGFKSEALSYTFLPGVLYWIAVHTNASFSVRAVLSTVNIGLTSGSGSVYGTLVSDGTSPTELEDPFDVNGGVSGGSHIAVRMRIA